MQKIYKKKKREKKEKRAKEFVIRIVFLNHSR
jgi:hypothetical protein